MQLMFQDPYASLDPRMRVGSILREPLVVQHIGTSAERDDRVGSLMGEVGLAPRRSSSIPTSSPVVNASGSAWPGPWPSTPS